MAKGPTGYGIAKWMTYPPRAIELRSSSTVASRRASEQLSEPAVKDAARNFMQPPNAGSMNSGVRPKSKRFQRLFRQLTTSVRFKISAAASEQTS